MKPGRAPVTVRTSGKPAETETLVATHVQPPHRAPKPQIKTTLPKKSRKKMPWLHRWTVSVAALIQRAPSRWTTNDLEESDRLQRQAKSVPSHVARRVAALLRGLAQVHALAVQTMGQAQRGTGTQHAHPNRNAITDFLTPGSDIRWATKKRRPA